MTAAVRIPGGIRPAPLAGWAVVLRLSIARERRPILAWGAATIAVVLSSVQAITSLYPDAASRALLARTIATNPAFLALNGPLPDTSIGGVAAWRIGVYGAAAVSFLGASTVVRRTRAEEESGRAELLSAGVLGRFTLLASALALSWTVCLVIGLLCATGCIAQRQPIGGSLAFGAALAGPGLVFAALAAVAAQVFASARAALSATGVLLGVAYGVRAVADTAPAARWLSYLSPLGWSQRLSPYGNSAWWVLLLFPGAAMTLAAIAARLQLHRDVGLGLFRVRLGPAGSSRLHSGFTVAARLHRSRLLGWTAGLAVFGALTGSLAATSADLLGGNRRIEQIVRQIAGAGSPSQELFAVMAGIAGVLAAAYAVAAALQVRIEEVAGRAELALSTPLSRRGLLAGHLTLSLAGAATLLLVAGVCAGLVYGAQTGDIAGGLGTGVAATAVQIAAVTVVGGLTAALIGWLPRWSPAAWGLLAAFVLIGQLGQTLGVPQLVRQLSPFTHVPALPTESFAVEPVVILLVLGALATTAGFLGFLRRDIG